jgi:hypothetical protein
MVANAGGWAPIAEVFDFDGRTLQQNFLLRDQLQIRGKVTADGAFVPGAVVALLEAGGGHVGTTLTDGNGGYAFPLPVAGRYVLTMLHPLTQEASAQKVTVDIRSIRLDFTAPRAEETYGESVGA